MKKQSDLWKVAAVAFIPLPLILSLFLTFAQGCKTTGEPTPVVASPAVLQVMQTGAQIGTYFTIAKYPDSRAYFEAAGVVIGALINSGNVDAAAVVAAIDGIKINELHNAEARLAITAALQLYQLQWGQAVAANIDAKTYCIPILAAFRNGILAGLDSIGSEAKLGLKIQKR
jgi:hypothetical protein